MNRYTLALSVSLMSLAWPACTTSSSGPATPDGSADPARSAGICAAQPTDTVCTTCQKESCCTEGAACQNSPACLALVTCTEKCRDDDNACLNACAEKNAGGVQAYVRFSQCFVNKCTNACDGGAASGGMCQLPPKPDACDRCLATSCCGQLNACEATPACAKLLKCATTCPDGDKGCQQSCANANSAGVTPLTRLLDCVDGPCAKACD